MTQEEKQQIENIVQTYGGGWDCFIKACQEARLSLLSNVPKPTPFEWVRQYCKERDLDCTLGKCQIILFDHPAILFVKTDEPLIAHSIFVESLLHNWNDDPRTKTMVMLTTPGIKLQYYKEKEDG